MSEATSVISRPVAVTAGVFGLLALIVGLIWWSAPQSGTADLASDDLVLAQADEAEGEDAEGDVALQSVDVTYDFFLARDPFESIMPPDEPPPPTDPTDPTDPSDPTDPDDPTEPDGACRTNEEAVCDGIVVAVTAVEAQQATIQVDGVGYVVVPGQTFAERFSLVRIVDGECVDLLYMDGDEAEVFRLCVGDPTAK